jgi:riboflavin synthase
MKKIEKKNGKGKKITSNLINDGATPSHKSVALERKIMIIDHQLMTAINIINVELKTNACDDPQQWNK